MVGVQFHAEHHFSSSSVDVMAAMVDAGLYANLQFPDLSQTEVLGRRSDGSRTSLRLRLAFIGRLDPLGRRLIGSDQLSWVQEIEADTSTGTGQLTFASEDPSRRLHGQADITFHLEHDGTSRQIDGDLVVAVPFVAAAVESRIIAGLLRNLDLEAQAIREQLNGNQSVTRPDG
jgi:hypothetical protein